MGLRGSTVGMVRDAADSIGSVDYAARMFSTTQTFIPSSAKRIRSISASYTWQNTGDDNEPGLPASCSPTQQTSVSRSRSDPRPD
jgi:hypothetical protein